MGHGGSSVVKDVAVYTTYIHTLIALVYPPCSNSHHQDHYICSRESQPKPLFATIASWGKPGGSSNLLRWFPGIYMILGMFFLEYQGGRTNWFIHHQGIFEWVCFFNEPFSDFNQQICTWWFGRSTWIVLLD